MDHTPDHSLETFKATSKFGTFFGVAQQIFDAVWGNLTDPNGNSAVYITMEIGADPDVYLPVKQLLLSPRFSNPKSATTIKQIKKFTHGPGKIPNYSGGLGILAGDTLKSYADCRLPVVAVSLLYREGYFSQFVDSKLGQISQKVHWHPEATPALHLLNSPGNPEKPLQVEVPLYLAKYPGKKVIAQVWMKIEMNHLLDYFIPEILLDFDLPSNPEIVRKAATQLYKAETPVIKAVQRNMLGAAVLPVLQELEISSATYHLNEQHGVSLALHLVEQELKSTFSKIEKSEFSESEIKQAAGSVAEQLVYTIHTPVKAGHDRFSKLLYSEICSPGCRQILDVLAVDEENPLEYNFTKMAMRVNHSANSVSRLHRDVTHKQFPQFAHKISAITNGVHHLTWISNKRAALFDSSPFLSNWRSNPGVFAKADSLLTDTSFRRLLKNSWRADTEALVAYVNNMLQDHRQQMTETWIDPPNFLSTLLDDAGQLDSDVLTIGFARRFSTYKRADLIFYDMEMFCKVIRDCGRPVNFLFAGKAHPSDEPGKTVLKVILDRQKELYELSGGLAKLVFIPGYDMSIAKMMVSGVHVWLNCPKRPLEASGTSGMKAALNGVPNLSILDGWWVEGYHNGQSGWKFGHEGPIDSESLNESREELLYFEDSSAFYRILAKVMDQFYEHHNLFLDKAINNLLLNIPIFNTHRLASEYLKQYELVLPTEQKKEMINYAELYSSDN